MKKFLGFFTLSLLLSANSFASPTKHNTTVEPQNAKKAVEKKVAIISLEEAPAQVVNNIIDVKKGEASAKKTELETKKDAKKSAAKQNLQDAASKIENY